MNAPRSHFFALCASAVTLLLLLAGCDASSRTEKHDHHREHAHDHDPHERAEKHDDHGHDEHGKDAHKKHAHDDHGHDEHGHDEHGHDEHEEGMVTLSRDALSRAGIQVSKARISTLKGGLRVPAEVQLHPDHVSHISPLVDGQIIEVKTSVGDLVKAGQHLVTLRSVTLGQSRADLARASALLEVARKNHRRQEQLRKDGISSERSLLEARFALEEASAEKQAAQSRLRVFGVRGGTGPDMKLNSPIDGSILERHATRGENVSNDNDLFMVADLSTVWVIGKVYERQISEVRVGMKATLTLTAYPGRHWEGKVSYIAPSLDHETRSLDMRVELENTDGALKPGLFGDILVESPKEEAELFPVVPEEALQEHENRTVVFVPEGKEGKFHAVPVVVGRRSGGSVEILKGLQRDTQVVTRGAFVLKSELVRSQLGHGHAH